MIKNVVWIVKEQVRSGEVGPRVMDYTPAMDFGEIRFITEFDIPLHPSSSVTTKWTDDVQKFLNEFDPARDYLILTGHTLSIFLIGMLVAKIRAFPRILVWRREQNRYVLFDTTNLKSFINRS